MYLLLSVINCIFNTVDIVIHCVSVGMSQLQQRLWRQKSLPLFEQQIQTKRGSLKRKTLKVFESNSSLIAHLKY